MKILTISDTHFEGGNAYKRILPDHDVMVICGDLDAGEDAAYDLVGGWRKVDVDGHRVSDVPQKPIVYVAGNHEPWSLWQTMDQVHRKMAWIVKDDPLVNFLNPGLVAIQDPSAGKSVRFIGATLWTDYKLFGEENQAAAMAAAAEDMNDHRRITVGDAPNERRLFTPADAVALHMRDLTFIVNELEKPHDGPTVIVTHHGPSMRSVPERFDEDLTSAAFASNLDWVCERYAPSLWLHGHTHDSFDYTIGRTRVVCNPMGYGHQPNPEFKWDMVIDTDDLDYEAKKGFGL